MNTQEAIITRRSVRAFTDEEITEAELKSVLDAAYCAPIAGTLYQTMRLTVVQNRLLLGRISAFYKEAGGVKDDVLFGAPLLIIVSGARNFSGTELSSALFANAGCIIENIQLSAWELGLGSVFNWSAGTLLPKSAELLGELGIPGDFTPLAGVVVGHPAETVPERTVTATMKTSYIR